MSVPMVAIDARMTRQMSVGMQLYVRELVVRLPKVATDLRFIAVTNAELQTHPDMGVVRIDERTAKNASLREHFLLPRIIKQTGAAIVHYCTPYAPRWSPQPYVYTIHDLIHLRFPRMHSWKIQPYYALLVGPVARGAAAVFVPTQSTAADVTKYLRVENSRLRVVPLGVSEAFRLSDADRAAAGKSAMQRFGLHRPYFLYAGNHRKHKNLHTLATGWQRCRAACDLAITEDGPFGFDIDALQKPNGAIVKIGHVPIRDLIGLYAGCTAAVQPSLYEGFGLSVAEAMAAGAPCVIAQTPALLEVAGDAALTFPAHDADALAGALDAIAEDPLLQTRTRDEGRRRAASFSWDDTIRAIAAAYREAIASTQPRGENASRFR
jgi:glycosyltransferase involved in cell wall biosynthesis